MKLKQYCGHTLGFLDEIRELGLEGKTNHTDGFYNYKDGHEEGVQIIIEELKDFGINTQYDVKSGYNPEVVQLYFYFTWEN